MKKRLIDAIELVNHFALRENAALISGVTSSAEVWARAKWLAQDAPTIDAVEVVRCKDCEYRGMEAHCPMCHTVWTWDEDEGSDYYITDNTADDGFCNLGARGDSDA